MKNRTQHWSSLSGGGMRTLSTDEMGSVAGGIGPGIVVMGALGGAAASLGAGDDWRGVALGAVFGAMTGVSGAMMAVTSGFVRMSWGLRAIGYSVSGGAMGSQLVNQK